MSALSGIRVVLVAPQVPGNIGASARAMAAMGLGNLTLVSPRAFPHPDATRRATEAAWLLDQALCVDSLAEAVADCELVIAATARSRRGMPTLSPPQAAERLRSAAGPAALVFGPEPGGLTRSHLALAQFQTKIPLAPGAHSLNLSHAVQLYAWELARSDTPAMETAPRASQGEMAHFYGELARMLRLLEPALTDPAPRLRRYRALFSRAGPTRDEWQMLEGLVRRVMRRLDDQSGEPE